MVVWALVVAVFGSADGVVVGVVVVFSGRGGIV